MARGSKFQELEIQLASSVLYYDEEEMNKFFEVFDLITEEESKIILDGTFLLFTEYLRKIDLSNKNDCNPEDRKNFILSEIKTRNSNNPNKTQRENFDLWLQKVLDTDVPMELAEDILYHFIWENFKQEVENYDKTSISFKEKLNIRPKIPTSMAKKDIIDFNDIIPPKEVNDYSKFTTSLYHLDKTVHINKTNFIVIGARPGVGKSRLMLNMAIENALKGTKVLFVSLEMNEFQMDERAVNYIIQSNLRNEYLDENNEIDYDAYIKAYKKVKASEEYKLFSKNAKLLKCVSSSADSLLRKIEDLVKEDKYEIVFIDYLQLLRYNDLEEWASLRNLTSALKKLAFINDIVVVTASQVSRQSTERGLFLTDLFGSSTIENDPDLIIGMEAKTDIRQNDRALLNVKVLKQREGSLSELLYNINYSTGRMELNS